MNRQAASGRPDKSAILQKLKGFQRRTVDHVVDRLLDPAGSRRFLVADEVGLGKTLIARGVIAEMVDRLWDEVGRVDVLYICSNSALARDNLSKIKIGGAEIPATRLTLLPRELHRFDPKLNFISFTPGTALNVDGYGHAEERLILYSLLWGHVPKGAWLRNLLQGGVKNNWRRRVRSARDEAVDDHLRAEFLRRLDEHEHLQCELAWARDKLTRTDRVLSDEERSRRYQLVGALRTLLAQVCIGALEPDLVILDEFQRFKDLLAASGSNTSELSDLASQLFNYETPEGNRIAMLMLSATPYRMFATDAEAAQEDHYEDFVQTLQFLFDDPVRMAEVEDLLARYRAALRRAASGVHTDVTSVRDELQRVLKLVMVRTERVDSTTERDAMVAERRIAAKLTTRDLLHFQATDRLAEAVEGTDVVEYWKSAPYLFNFMKTYRLKSEFDDRRHIRAVRDAFDETAHELLSEKEVQAYREVDPANARLRALAHASLGNGQWSTLWIAPTLPYWPLGRAWRENQRFTKKLVFSAWNVVPDAVSALLSYEAERNMIASAGRAGARYSNFYRKRKPLLRFAMKEGHPSNMSTLALALPCLTLADRISPLASFLAGHDVRESATADITQLLDDLRGLAHGANADVRWYWAAPLLLDRKDESLLELLESWDAHDGGEDDDADEDADQDRSARGTRGLQAHLDEALRVLRGETQLGALPDDLGEVLLDFALGSPGTLAARSFAHKCASRAARRQAGVVVASGFRTLFNQPPVIHMLRSSDQEEAYWRETLHYSIDGNLQALLDEQVHLLWEQSAWDDPETDETALRVARAIRDGATTKVSRISPDIYAGGERRVEVVDTGTERLSLRTSFALRYGSVTGETQHTDAREEAVRAAFKSPFYPFVLVSTSVGQEGLDFHPWCHEIWHWNLPGNPVDLEQREGRVHRYKGHAVRKNVAEAFLPDLRTHWRPGRDPWDVLFDCAERTYRASHGELVPYWLCPGPHKVERCVPMLPYSKEVEKLRRLKRSLAIYRVVFGQPRQEELLELLESSNVDRRELDEWAVRLRP